MSLWQVSIIAFGPVIGLGLIAGTVLPLQFSGPSAVLAYAMAGLMLLLLVRCLAALTADGNSLSTFSESVARHLGGNAACFTRAAYFLTAVAIAGTEVAFVVPIIKQWMPGPAADALIGVGVLFLLTVVTGRSARAFAYVEVALSALKVFALMGLVVAMCYVVGTEDDPTTAPGTQFLAGIFEFDTGLLWISFIVATLGFAGIEVISVVAPETSATPAAMRSRMLSIASSLAVLTVFAVAATSTLTHAISLPPNMQPSLYLLDLLSKPHARIFFNLLILITILSVMNSQLYCASRMLREAAMANDLPKLLGRLSPAAPRVAVFATFACSAAVFLILTADVLLVFRISTAVATVGVLSVWLMIFIAALRMASQNVASNRTFPPLKRWEAALGAGITVAIVVSLYFFEQFDSTLQRGLPIVLTAGIGALAVKRTNQN